MIFIYLIVIEFLLLLFEIDDWGVYFEDLFISWCDYIWYGVVIVVVLWECLDLVWLLYVGVLLQNMLFFLVILVVGVLLGIVLVGFNLVCCGVVLVGDIVKVDCQLVFIGLGLVEVLVDVEYINVDFFEWIDEVVVYWDIEVCF